MVRSRKIGLKGAGKPARALQEILDRSSVIEPDMFEVCLVYGRPKDTKLPWPKLPRERIPFYLYHIHREKCGEALHWAECIKTEDLRKLRLSILKGVLFFVKDYPVVKQFKEWPLSTLFAISKRFVTLSNY